MRKSLLALATLSLAWFVANDACGATHYKLTDLGTFGGAWIYAMATDINNSGQVSGWCATPNYGDQHACLWSNGTLTDLGTLGGHYSAAWGINSSGQVVGSAHPATGWYHAFMYDGTMHDLGLPASAGESDAMRISDSGMVTGNFWREGLGQGNQAFLYDGAWHELGSLLGPDNPGGSYGMGINSRGAVVGRSMSPSGREHAFLYSKGTMQDLGVLPGMERSQANSINELGLIAGISDNVAGTYRGFLYDGTMHDLGTVPGFQDSVQATDINNHNQIVGAIGNWSTTPYTVHAFLYENGTIADLNPLVINRGDYTLMTALAINDLGQIVGYATNPQADGGAGRYRPFLVTPVLPGDADTNGKVDVTDLNDVLSNFGRSGVNWYEGDFNDDGVVDLMDLTVLLANYNRPSGSSSAGAKSVPEPSGLVLFGIVVLGVATRIWVRRTET